MYHVNGRIKSPDEVHKYWRLLSLSFNLITDILNIKVTCSIATHVGNSLIHISACNDELRRVHGIKLMSCMLKSCIAHYTCTFRH